MTLVEALGLERETMPHRVTISRILGQAVQIDEPELGLHPYAITLLAGLLKSAATQT